MKVKKHAGKNVGVSPGRSSAKDQSMPSTAGRAEI